MKKINSVLVFAVALGMGLAFIPAGTAQAFSFYSHNSNTNYGVSCVTISRDLAYGARGQDVSNLQSFLVAQQYPGGGSWMITGYYGKATVAAVRNFQSDHGLVASGVVDAATRAALANCGVAQSYDYRAYENSYNLDTHTSAGFYNTYGIPTLSALSVNTGTIGSQVTIYGSGFDYVNNTVNIGTVSIVAPSANGTAITFVIPQYITAGTMQISVSNARGTSNALSFTVWNYPQVCNFTYGYGYTDPNCACSIYGGCTLPPNNLTNPTVGSLSPTSGAVGTSVTVYGTGFSTTGNTVHFGNGIITNLGSQDGRAVSFIVPATISGYGATQTVLGAYNVSVTNSYGYTSNALPFTVTSLGATAAPTITSVSGPTMTQVGAQGTWAITLNSSQYAPYVTTQVNWGDVTTYAAQASSQVSSALSFTHTYYVAGTYTITFTVTNVSGQSNTATATVVVR